MEVSGKTKNGSIKEDKGWKYQNEATERKDSESIGGGGGGGDVSEERQGMEVSGKIKNGSIR